MKVLVSQRWREGHIAVDDPAVEDFLSRMYPAIWDSGVYYGRLTQSGYLPIRTKSLIIALTRVGFRLTEVNQQGNRSDPPESQSHYICMSIPMSSAIGMWADAKGVFDPGHSPEIIICNSMNGKTSFQIYASIYNEDSDLWTPLDYRRAEAFRCRHRRADRDIGFIGQILANMSRSVFDRIPSIYQELRTTEVTEERLESFLKGFQADRKLPRGLDKCLRPPESKRTIWDVYHHTVGLGLNSSDWSSPPKGGSPVRTIESVTRRLPMSRRAIRHLLAEEDYK